MLLLRAITALQRGEFLQRLRGRVLRYFETPHSAADVTHQQALQWFEHRKAEYAELIAAASPYVDPQGVVFDVGANIGYFTFLLAKHTGFTGTAYLFEPVPHLATLCKATFRNVPYQAEVFDFGLSDRDEETTIFIASNGNLGWNTLIQQKTTPEMKAVDIRLRRFDSYGIGATPSFIKIDVEGAEYKVLRGMVEHLSAWTPRPVILCEVAWGQSHPNWQDELSAFADMKQLGYVVCDLNGNHIDETTLQTTADILFIPQDRLH